MPPLTNHKHRNQVQGNRGDIWLRNAYTTERGGRETERRKSVAGRPGGAQGALDSQRGRAEEQGRDAKKESQARQGSGTEQERGQ